MNNSYFAVESVNLHVETPVDHTPEVREREVELVKILGAIRKVQDSKDWSTLKENVFDGVTQNLSDKIQSEAKKTKPDVDILRYLTGQLVWAEKFSDLSKLEAVFRQELTNIRKQYGTTEKD
jgi:hypothetical protein